jgi:hypothetical protein
MIFMILIMLGFTAFAAHHPCIESLSDCGEVQLLEDITTQKILMSSAKERLLCVLLTIMVMV